MKRLRMLSILAIATAAAMIIFGPTSPASAAETVGADPAKVFGLSALLVIVGAAILWGGTEWALRRQCDKD